MSWYEQQFNLLNHKLDYIIRVVQWIATKEGQMAKTLDEVVDAVAEETTKVDSLKTFVHGLRQQILDALAGVTLPPAAQAKVDQIFSGVDANSHKIVEAMAENVEEPPPADTMGGGTP